MDAVKRTVLFATPPKGGSLRDALPAVERLWRSHVGERVELMLGWATEPFDRQWETREAAIGEVADCIAGWEAEGRVELGESDVHLLAPACKVLFCHEADLHIESDDDSLLAEARAEFARLQWRCDQSVNGRWEPAQEGGLTQGDGA